MSDIVERLMLLEAALRKEASMFRPDRAILVAEAAGEITALQAEVERMKENGWAAFNLIGAAQFYVDNIGNFVVKPELSGKLSAAMELLAHSQNNKVGK